MMLFDTEGLPLQYRTNSLETTFQLELHRQTISNNWHTESHITRLIWYSCIYRSRWYRQLGVDKFCDHLHFIPITYKGTARSINKYYWTRGGRVHRSLLLVDSTGALKGCWVADWLLVLVGSYLPIPIHVDVSNGKNG